MVNLVGGALFALTFAVQGVLPEGTRSALTKVAEDSVARRGWAILMSAVVGGALVALLSFLLQAVNSVGSRIVLAFSVGFLLALGPFDHLPVNVASRACGAPALDLTRRRECPSSNRCFCPAYNRW